MTNLPTWAGIGSGKCPICKEPAFLYTHSLVDEIAQIKTDYEAFSHALGCFSCLSWIVSCAQTEERRYDEYGDMVKTPLYDKLCQLRNTLADNDWQEHEETCVTCSRPFVDTSCYADPSHWEKVEATHGRDRTIIVQVHRRCSVKMDCCNTTYAGGWSSRYGISSIRFEGEEVCEHCYNQTINTRGDTNRDYFTCNYCDNLWHNNERQRWGNRDYCEGCIDNNLYTCDECEGQYWDGDDHYCYNEDDMDGVIHEYGYKPRPFFFGKKPDERLYFGVELEVENRSTDSTQDLAQMVQDTLGERVYLKYDGSLTNGFEIVTHPHSLQSFHKEFGWESFQRFRQEGLRSWNTDTCGLHVHVSRDAFGIPYDNRTNNRAEHIKSRQAHEIKFIKLIYDNERQICRLAGRSNPEFANFSDKGKIVPKVKWNDTVGGRHAAVNTGNDTTLEVRVFKGSLQPARVLAAVELVHAAVEYTRDLKVTGPKTMYLAEDGKVRSSALSWLAFSGYVSSNADVYPNLTRLMVKTFESDHLFE